MSKRKVPTIASDVIKNHDSTPLFAWIRDFFLGVKRSPVTPPPGIPGPDGKVVYQNPNRFANNQSSRNVEPALAQGGVHHKIADNYYYERDGRRMVLPPTPIYKVLEEGKPKLMTPRGEELAPEKLNEVKGMMIGHEQNYGFSPRVPTPGFGYEWNRNVGNEEPSQQVDSKLARVQIYDKYMKADRK